MNIDYVSTSDDFISFDRGLLEMASSCRRSLERYLSAVLRLVSHHRDEQPTWRLLAQTIAVAFEGHPLQFNNAWLLQGEPPASLTRPGNPSGESFEELVRLLHFQIADLHRMALAGTLEEPICDDGIASPTGQRWFNFSPASFLEAAANGMAKMRSGATCSWSDLATFLWLGQTYHV